MVCHGGVGTGGKVEGGVGAVVLAEGREVGRGGVDAGPGGEVGVADGGEFLAGLGGWVLVIVKCKGIAIGKGAEI